MPRSRPRHWAGLAVLATILIVTAFAVLQDEPISPSGFDRFQLEDVDLAEVMPAEPVDSMQLIEMFGAPPGNIVAAWGTPCASATNEAACVAELEAVIDAAGPTIHSACGICSQFRLVVTRGDEVFNVDELRAFIGSIETATEAALATSVASWVREVPGGYETIESRYTAECDPIIEVTTLYKITFGGQIEVLDTHTATERNSCI